jgi:hypothetical protein
MSLPVEVVAAHEKGNCILFVGRRAVLEAVKAEGGSFPGQKKLARLLAGKKSEFDDALKGAERRLGPAGLGREMAALLDCSQIEPGVFHLGAVTNFNLIFTTCQDDLLERAAAAQGLKTEVFYRGDTLPVAEEGVLRIYKFWGGFERPDTLFIWPEGQDQQGLPADLRKSLRKLLTRNVLFFVGYRPDESEFAWVYEELETGFGGKLPRSHLAVAQGKISDYFWQKWVWKGLLLFTADPSYVMKQLEDGKNG